MKTEEELEKAVLKTDLTVAGVIVTVVLVAAAFTVSVLVDNELYAHWVDLTHCYQVGRDEWEILKNENLLPEECDK